MSHKRIVFDVSTLLEWSRPPVGIVRTQLELAKWLVCNASVPPLFVAFDEGRSRLSPVATEHVSRLLDRLESSDVDAGNWLGGLLPRIRQSIKKSIKKCLPDKVKEMAKRGVKLYQRDGLATFSKKLCRRVLIKLMPGLNVSWLSATQASTDHLPTELPQMIRHATEETGFLGCDDVYVAVGLDWDHCNYEYLYWAKKVHHFQFVGIFYDGIPIQYPEYVRSEFFPALFFRHFYFLSHLSDRVACISNYSRDAFRQISSQFAIARVPDLKTIYLGEKILHTDGTTRNLPEKFVLYVSTIEARKNHLLLLKCWKEAIAQGKKLPDLVFVGMWGWGIEEVTDFINDSPEIKNHLHIFNDVGDEELASMYKKAYLSVFPSFVEGWGLGAAESLAYGTPCLISDADALKEATRNMMPALSPTDEQAWLAALDYYSNNRAAYLDLKDKAVKGFVPKTWEQFSGEFFEYALGESV